MPYDLTHMWNLQRTELTDKLVVAGGRACRLGEMGEGGQKVQTPSNKDVSPEDVCTAWLL